MPTWKYTPKRHRENIPPPVYGADVFEEEKSILKISEDIETWIDYVNDFQETIDSIIKAGSLKKWAALEAMNSIAIYSTKILINEYKKAAIESKEYNYNLFARWAENAFSMLDETVFSLKFISPEDPTQGITVFINLASLGDTEEWMSAVREAREMLSSKSVENIEMRSKMWREKIYGAGREGGKITKVKTKKGENKTTEEDVTDRYSGLYEKTINTRLSKIPSNHIPWWELLNNGNISFGEGFGEDGEPYPIFAATNFVEKSEIALKNLWNKYFSEFESKAKQFFSDQLSEDFGLKFSKGFGKAFENIDEQVAARVQKEVLEKAVEAPEHKVFDYVNITDKEYALVKSKGRIIRKYPVWKHGR